MMASKHLGEFIQQLSEVFMEFCKRAEMDYNMGVYSGTKRTLMMYLRQYGDTFADDLLQVFPDPAAPKYASQIFFELAQAGFIKIESVGPRTLLKITEVGIQKCQEIRNHEEEFIKSFSPMMPMSEITRATQTLARLRHQLMHIREASEGKETITEPSKRAA